MKYEYSLESEAKIILFFFHSSLHSEIAIGKMFPNENVISPYLISKQVLECVP